jgi:hypothetical protein
LPLEDVWAALPEERWESVDVVARASGLTRDVVDRCISFLVRWDFVESEYFPHLRVRRRLGVVSPTAVIKLLRSLVGIQESSSGNSKVIAERIACRICGSRQFKARGPNQVECCRCSERQWFRIKANEP